jgi:hypothetical protein
LERRYWAPSPGMTKTLLPSYPDLIRVPPYISFAAGFY